jgi:hypothetical protein
MVQQILPDDGNADVGTVDIGVACDKDDVRLVPSETLDFLCCGGNENIDIVTYLLMES